MLEINLDATTPNFTMSILSHFPHLPISASPHLPLPLPRATLKIDHLSVYTSTLLDKMNMLKIVYPYLGISGNWSRNIIV